jgi:hypothetical protein
MPVIVHIHMNDRAELPVFLRDPGTRGGAPLLIRRYQPLARKTGGHFDITRQQDIRRFLHYRDYSQGNGGWQTQIRALFANAVFEGEETEPDQPDLDFLDEPDEPEE